ncbi:MAG: hypothetical protein JSS72_01315 [Armatimonadetes bacterium]|nr:hypothetical protein [Armatimonadota bacterium]
MRQDVLQAVALCSFGNQFFRSGEDRGPELRLTNANFKTACEIGFERGPEAGILAGTAADGTSSWFRRMKHEGAENLVLALANCPYMQNDPRGPWGVMIETDRGTEIWQPTWKLRSVGDNDATPWRVTYLAKKANRWDVKNPLPPQEAAAKIESVCKEAIANLEPTQPTFSAALARCLYFFNSGNDDLNGVLDLYASGTESWGRVLFSMAVRLGTLLQSKNWKQVYSESGADSSFSAITNTLWELAMTTFEAAMIATGEIETALAQPRALEDLSQAS